MAQKKLVNVNLATASVTDLRNKISEAAKLSADYNALISQIQSNGEKGIKMLSDIEDAILFIEDQLDVIASNLKMLGVDPNSIADLKDIFNKLETKLPSLSLVNQAMEDVDNFMQIQKI